MVIWRALGVYGDYVTDEKHSNSNTAEWRQIYPCLQVKLFFIVQYHYTQRKN
jgi:hypothetical protein